MTTMSVRGVSLFVKVIGHGHPMAIMHGGPGTDHSTMLSLRPCSDRFGLVFYDHRCNGRSTGAEVTSLTWENLTANVDAQRESLGFDKWAVLGTPSAGRWPWSMRSPSTTVVAFAPAGYVWRCPMGTREGAGATCATRVQP